MHRMHFRRLVSSLGAAALSLASITGTPTAHAQAQAQQAPITAATATGSLSGSVIDTMGTGIPRSTVVPARPGYGDPA